MEDPPIRQEIWGMSHVKWKTDICWRRYKIQETLCIGQWCLNHFQSRHLGTSHSSPSISSTAQNTAESFVVSPLAAAPSCFPESYRWSEISFLSKVILVSGKARSCRVPNLGCRGAESPGWFKVSPKTLHKMWCMSQSVVMMKLPVTSCP